MIRALPIFHPLCIILALIVLYRSITGGVDIFYSVFRSVSVYSVCMILALIANNIYLLMFRTAKEKSTEEAKNLILETLQTIAGDNPENEKKGEEERTENE